jgi:membrane associated rhomboid family serine protease
MLFIFPTGHEETHARRWPWITTLIIACNLLLFVGLHSTQQEGDLAVERSIARAVEHLKAHPYLTPPPLLAELLTAKDKQALAEARAENPEPPAEEQVELDGLVQQALTALHATPSFHFGYRPADMNLLGLLTHQFLHGGWLHLLGNMWFLWLVGCVVEDAWGRLAFPAFYLLAGVVGALAHHAAQRHSLTPLIGASGAIAGAMGAFLVRHAKTKINFIALIFVKPRRFAAPAYLMLPLWFLVQLAWGMGESDGVAYWAHVGGFAFGVGGALLMRFGGVEKQLDEAIENRGARLEDPAITAAAGLIDAGNAAAAIAQLESLIAQNPRRIDAWLELLRASSAAGDSSREKRVKLKLIELYLQDGLGEGALSLYEELGEADRLALVSPALRLRLARQYERVGRADRACALFEHLHAPQDRAAVDWSVASAALIAHAELSLKLARKQEALSLWTRAAAHGDPQFQGIVKQGLNRARALPD